MRDPARIDRVLELVGTAWRRAPDLRLGQLIYNVAPPGADPAQLEDDHLEELLSKFVQRLDEK